MNDRPARAETATEGVFRQLYRREDGLTHLSRPGLHERTANRTTPSIDGSINCSIFFFWVLLSPTAFHRVRPSSFWTWIGDRQVGQGRRSKRAAH